MDCYWVKIRWMEEELGEVAMAVPHLGEARAKLPRRQGMRLYHGRLADNINYCGKHQVHQSFIECEHMCSTIALWS